MKLVSLILILLVRNGLSKVDKYVRISLDAKWKNTPLALEASEYIADADSGSFWKFIERFDGKEKKTDKAIYDEIFASAKDVVSSADLDMLKFSLSVRNYSPRVQLHYQLSIDLKQDCGIFFQSADDKTTCDLDKVLNDRSSFSVTPQEFDHIYPGTELYDTGVIVYADFTKDDFKEVHRKLVQSSNEHKFKYILRHFYQIQDDSAKVRLSGYGVELAIKSTEYKNVDDQKVADTKKKEKLDEGKGDDEVEGFLFNRLRELHPLLKEDLDKFKTHLKESNKELAPLKVWQLQDLSFQAAQRVMSASSSDALKVLKDVSQNAPMLARSLVKTKVTKELQNEIIDNQKEFGVQAGEATLYINGVEISVEELNAFKLLKVMKSETKAMDGLSRLDLEKSKAGKLLSLNVKPEQEDPILDARSESVQWLNDLENDDQYNYWPRQLQEILRPTFPGMLRYIAKNIFHAVLYMDPTVKESIDILLQFESLIENSTPVRFGVVFVADGKVTDKPDENVGAALMRAFSFIKSDKDVKSAFSFIMKLYKNAKNDVPEAKDVIKSFAAMYGHSEVDEVLGPDSEYDDMRRVSKIVFDSLGLKSLPQILVNGQQLAKEDMTRLEGSITETVLQQTPPIQQAVYMGQHYGYPNIMDYIMSQPNVVSRLNKLIQTLPGKFALIGESKGKDSADELMTKEEAVGTLMDRAKYFVQDHGATTIWVIADAQTKDGLNLIKNALLYVVKQKNARLALVLHGGDSLQNKIIQNVLNLRQKLISGVAKLLTKLLIIEDFIHVANNPDFLNKVSNGITGINKKKLSELMSSADSLERAGDIVKQNTLLVKKAFQLSEGENMVFANGRVFGPLKTDDVFEQQDFELLQNFENNRGGAKVSEIINSMKLPNLPSEGHERYKSDVSMKAFAALSQRGQESRKTLQYREDKHSVVKLPAKGEGVSYLVDAVMDPLSKDAQKLIPILMVLHESFNVEMNIFMNCVSKHSEMPVKRFYQYVLQPELTFDINGNLKNDQEAIFKNLPHSALLTLIMDTPQSWMIAARGSNQDLDNIFLGQANELVYGDFELEHIIIEGHASDANTHQPPRGLQFVLGTQKQPDQFDTIVMANLGYFQLKAYPGSFVLQLRSGRSAAIYKIDSLEGGKVLHSGHNYTVVVDSFTGTFLKTKVARREGQEKADLLGDEGGEEDESGGLWNSFASYVTTGSSSTKVTEDKIHIFSVATGLLYERFLRIMMLSVLKHTKTPVKFWFLKNYLSSEFTKFLPYYAEKHGFEYELVQYQWPKWLNGQTEKQRIIWGYKILFLDVLFPLNLERIIFVDADQIVRADLKELMDMDLNGAPYAYTPFCNDRKEVEGFRFWNQGYWRNHLAGRPYHISALYVVDLKRFRRVAAGDRLRGQYQGLSQDPNSLANLDQDLPNNMIHQVEIFSLPQDWLWCETWCSDESKKTAKTIDMCNNPQTKEPKLERAIRIAPEWTEYDDVIRKLQEEMNTVGEKQADKPDGKPKKMEL
eukprot:TCONS_00007064-protein